MLFLVLYSKNTGLGSNAAVEIVFDFHPQYSGEAIIEPAALPSFMINFN
jgi:hypothetical protein